MRGTRTVRQRFRVSLRRKKVGQPVSHSHTSFIHTQLRTHAAIFLFCFFNTFQTQALIRCSHAETWRSGLQCSLATQHSAPQQDSDDERQSAPQSSITCMRFAHQMLYNGCGQISTADAELEGQHKVPHKEKNYC